MAVTHVRRKSLPSLYRVAWWAGSDGEAHGHVDPLMPCMSSQTLGAIHQVDAFDAIPGGCDGEALAFEPYRQGLDE